MSLNLKLAEKILPVVLMDKQVQEVFQTNLLEQEVILARKCNNNEFKKKPNIKKLITIIMIIIKATEKIHKIIMMMTVMV